MSCKMVDALIDANPESYTWYSLNSPFRSEPGPNIHPMLSDHPLALVVVANKVKDVPEKLRTPRDMESLNRLIAEIRERCKALAEAKKSRK